MIHSDNMLGNGVLTLGNLDFNAALEASGRPAPNRSFLDTAIDATDINQDAPRQLEPVVNPLQRLTDVCLFNEDEEAAERVKDDVLVTETASGDVFGQNMLIGVELSEMMAGGDVYETAQRFIGALPREQQQAWRDKLDHCHTQSDGQALVGEMFRNGVVEQYRTNKARQEALEEERGMAFNGVFSELVKDANNEEAWNRFREGQARGAFTDADKKALDSAAKAWGMMEILMSDYTRSGAAVLTDAESGERIFNELYGDEMAQAVFLNVLQNEVQDLKNDASRRNALERFGRAFAASTNNLMAGVIGGKFKAFVTDEQVERFNADRGAMKERAKRAMGRGPSTADRTALSGFAPEDEFWEKVYNAAKQSGQLQEDGTLRKMTDAERQSTETLNKFRGQLFNAVQGMYDVPGVAAKLGKMMPDSMIYLVPGGMFASAGSMYTQELARQLGEGEDYVSANTKAAVEAGISAAVEKLAFGSMKPARMAPGLDWLMSRKVVGQALGKIYGSTAGRIGLGVVAGSAEETFAEPLAGLIMRGVYNVAAADELQLADPLGTYRKEMEEMLAPDQILVTGLYGLLLGGVSAGGHMQAAEDYREMYEHLVSIGVDEGRAAQAARDDAAVAGFKATKALFDEAVKKDTKGVIAYLAELYPQIEPLNVAENLFSTWQLPHLIPAENGQVKVQEKDEDGKVTETLMSKEAADLLVQARLEQMKSSEIAMFANQLLGVAMAGKASSETDRFIVEEVDGAMDADYFTRLANAAGVRLQQGARADEVDPEIHQHLTLGQLVQQGKAWEQRMEIQRNEVDRERAEKNLPPLTDEEWAERKTAYVAAVNRQSVRGADGRKRTLLRVSRGHYGAMNVLEDLTEDFIARDMAANNRGLEWYVQNIRELETALGRQNEFLRELGEGKKPVNQMDIIEAVGKIAQSKLLADTVKGEHGFSAALKSFLEMIRTLILKAAAMLKLGKAINQALTDETVRGKMDTEFLQLVDDVVAQDIEFLRELQLEEGLKAMQRVIAARQEAKADTRVKRRRKAKTPVLDKAEKNHGKEVREAARKKRRKQAKVDADVAAAEAALEGDFSSSVVNQEELDAIKAAAEKDGTFMKAPNGKPTNLTEQQWLQVRTVAFKEWFGDWENDTANASKIVDTNGEPLVVYHGTARSKPISIFKGGKTGYLGPGIYFTPEKRTASKYTGMYGDGLVYEGFVNMRNPLAISYADKPAKVILNAVKEGVYEKRIETQGNESQLLKKADLTKLRKKGYDGIVWAPMKALVEGSFESGEMLLFESNQIKSATDNSGTFDGDEDDITMSVTDAQERGLFENGVLEASNAVVTEPSFSIEALHATPHRFRKFDTSKMGTGEGAQAYGWGLYFSEDAASNEWYYRNFKQSNTVSNYRVELNVSDNNLLMWDKRYSGQEIKDLLGDELFERMYDEGDEDADLLDNGEGVYMLLRSVARGAKEASELLLKHGVKGIKYLDYGSRGDGKGTYNYVIFSGGDVKITGVNETGDYNAPWEEYEDTDASFSVESEYLENRMERNLAAVHTLSPEKFLSALELGGMPMPSVAVTRLDKPYGWGGAGNIMLVGRPALVDPKEGTEVYSRDAWTGNFPRVEHKVIGKKDRSDSVTDLHQLKQKYQEKGDYNSAIHQLDYRINIGYGGEQTGRSDMDYALRQRTGKALFAWQSGYQPRPKKKDATRVHEWLTKEVASRLRRYVSLSPDEYHEKWPEIKEEVRQEIEKVYRESSVIKNAPTQEAAEKRLSSWVNVALRAFDAYSPSALAQELEDVKKIDARVLDVEANLDMLAKYADKHKKAYEAWIEEKLNAWFSKESYIHGTKKEATLDNLAEYMLGIKARGEEKGLAFSSGRVRAYQAERLYSLQDIKDRRESLTDSEASNEMKAQTHEWMSEWREGVAAILAQGGVGSGFTVRDDAMETLSKVKGTPTAEKVRAAVRKMFRGASNLQALLNDTEVINAGVEALKSLHAELEDYMEAVPQRAVRMNEWEYAVMPESLKKNKAVMAGLRENGIRPIYHDGTEEGRKAALGSLVGDSDVSFSTVHVPLYQEILDTFEQRIAKDGRLIWASRSKESKIFRICDYPDVLKEFIPWGRDVIASKDVIKKLMNKHSMLPQDVAKLPYALWNPVAVFEDPKADKGFIVITDILAPNYPPRRKNKGDKAKNVQQLKSVMVVLELKAADNNAMITDVVSAYSADSTEKYNALLKDGYLRYADKERALMWASAEGDSILQLRTTALLKPGSGVILKADLQNVNTDFSSSLVNLDEEFVAREVVDAGQGFRANLAYSEAIMREMRGAMQRLRKLGSKTRTDREDAVAAMGTMVQMVKAAVAVLPKGYRFSVHPYLNRIEALAELAATGDIDLTSDIASKDILQLENAEGVDLKKPYDEMVKEYGNVKLAEALERIMHRVSEQLRKHAKDRAVEKITELVERLAPKKDPKTGKLKGGKMSADAYRDLATVDEAMKMNSEQLEAKLAALRADMAKPGISEALREQLEDEMMLYDQFGDLAGMTAEDAVAAYEALRVRVYFHRFEWDDKQARIRGARRAVVRRVVDGVGSVSQNEYNAKKRLVKPTKRLKNLSDILSGMPAALAGMRGYLPLRQMADELALRANAAGEAIKAWEAERWLALEALCKETMNKSWRECMDFMHKVQPSGVAFDRPKFRTVNVKTEELRELLAMTKEERKAEMKRRREAGGLEAERELRERDVQELQKKLEAMEEEGRVLSRVETRYMVEVQHEENLQLSRGEALYAILMFEQPTYTDRLIMQGYTFEVIEGLREYVGDGMLQFGYGLRELFAKQGDRIAAVYENAFGVPFPREENYFAARWVVTGMKENSAEQLLAGMAGTAGAGNGWMKQRVNHNLELDMTKDALQVFLQATSLTDTWMATQDIVADFKAWTRDADFERALTAVLGQESYDNLMDWIRILEQGGVQDCLNMGVSQDVINGLYGSGAVAILGLRIQTLLKQTPAIFNGLLGAHDISAAEWFATMSRMKNGDAPMTYKRMVNSTLMKMRQQGKAGNMAGQAVRSGDTASSAAEGLLMASMLPMEWVDARCTAIGLVPVWNVYYQRAVDQGASAQEAEQAAWEQTALVANLASQPIGWLNKIKIAQNRNPIVKSFFYMLSENTAKFALCCALWRGGKKMAAFRAWLVYGAANAAISAMLDALQGDPEEFEKGKWWEYMFSALYGPAAGIPGVGEALEAAVNALLNLTGEVADIDWMKKMKTRASAGRALVDVQGSWKAITRIYGFMTDNKEHSLAEYTRAVGTVSRTLAIGTGWMGNMFGYWSTTVAVLMNPIDFGARVWRNMKHYWD